ncbi:hypothetical protein JTB14_036763 [Gonioctena quinquepunctata]|nr:hypothetical protein JTB14_036763 [Gonioctena quinquepunctata]
MGTRANKRGEEDLQTLVRNVVLKLCSSEEFLNQLTTTITETLEEKYGKEIQSLKEINKSMLKKLENQEAQIYTLIEKQEKCDQYHKSRNIIVYGVSEEHNENCRSKLLDIFKNKMELHIDHVTLRIAIG